NRCSSSTRLKELVLGCYHPQMEEKSRGHRHRDGDDAVSVGAEFIGGIDPATASASAASSSSAAVAGGLDYRALIRQQRHEIAELKRAALEDSPRNGGRPLSWHDDGDGDGVTAAGAAPALASSPPNTARRPRYPPRHASFEGNGNGDGDGDGNGKGNGDGNGNGSSSGNGNGSGSGSGNGNGSGNGSCNGHDNGHGNDHGDGHGNGHGIGSSGYGFTRLPARSDRDPLPRSRRQQQQQQPLNQSAGANIPAHSYEGSPAGPPPARDRFSTASSHGEGPRHNPNHAEAAAAATGDHHSAATAREGKEGGREFSRLVDMTGGGDGGGNGVA
ncbi:unnamed protein product, partial [Laminaria digitata]